MTDLELALTQLDPEWPPTPDIAAAVRARIAAAPAPRAARRPWSGGLRARIAWAAAAVALLGAGTLAVSPDARSAVLRWLGIGSVEIRRATPSATPVRPSPLGETLGLGTPVTLEQARKEAGFPVRFPTALGRPDAVRLGRLDTGGLAVSLIYAPRPGMLPSKVSGVGLLVQEFRATVSEPMIEKTVSAGARVERLTIGGAPAYWIGGAAHGFGYETGGGNGGFEPQRLADHTLLVERDGVLLRVEGRVTRDRAIAIAGSIQ